MEAHSRAPVAAAAAILLIYVCCTVNGGHKRPGVWPFGGVEGISPAQS